MVKPFHDYWSPHSFCVIGEPTASKEWNIYSSHGYPDRFLAKQSDSSVDRLSQRLATHLCRADSNRTGEKKQQQKQKPEDQLDMPTGLAADI